MLPCLIYISGTGENIEPQVRCCRCLPSAHSDAVARELLISDCEFWVCAPSSGAFCGSLLVASAARTLS